MGASSMCSRSLFLLAFAVVVFAAVCCALGGPSTAQNDFVMRPNPKLKNGEVHEVTYLPGWSAPMPTVTYSGFINIEPTAPEGARMYMHYILCLSEGDPKTDPIVVWFNGGPGATSMWGLMVELGPWLLNDASFGGQFPVTGIPEPQPNPFRWTKSATILAFENPPPCGFSYCTPPGPAGNGTSCGPWNDTRTAITDAEALRIFLDDHFPLLFRSNEIYLFGESYAGVYIGSLADVLFSQPQYATVRNHIAGFGLCDACLGTEVLCGSSIAPWYYLMFMYGHGQYSTELYEELLSVCDVNELKKKNPVLPAACSTMIQKVRSSVGGGFGYHLYDDCTDNEFLSSVRRRTPKPLRDADGQVQFSGYACPGTTFAQYMNRTDVRQALHVPLNSYFFIADNGHGFEYHLTTPDVVRILTTIVKRYNESSSHRVRLLVFNGEADPAIMQITTESIWYEAAKNYSFKKTAEWRPWTSHANMIDGHVVEWDNGQLQFVTVRGSGHMVPEYKPLASLVMMDSFVKKQPLPAYVPPPSSEALQEVMPPQALARFCMDG